MHLIALEPPYFAFLREYDYNSLQKGASKMDITAIDKNMLGDGFCADGLKFYLPRMTVMSVHGMHFYDHEGGQYYRLDPNVAKEVNRGVNAMNSHLAGGRFIFRTDSTTLAIRFNIPWDGVKVFNQANSGIDLYVRENGKQKLLHTYKPTELDENRNINISRKLGEKKERELIIYMPAMAGIWNIYVGLDEDAYIKEPSQYTHTQPIVFYGSSIVHGAQSYRPALAYPSIISRKYDIDFLNLGFSGSAKGEQVFADYIKKLDMCAFVLDYDHNAPTPEHLRETHESFYKTVREANPDIPIIMITRPHFHEIPYEEAMERRDIIYTTYQNAKARGENVYFIDGGHFYDDFGGDDCVADDSHPNAIGMFAMATGVSRVLEEALGIKRVI